MENDQKINTKISNLLEKRTCWNFVTIIGIIYHRVFYSHIYMLIYIHIYKNNNIPEVSLTKKSQKKIYIHISNHRLNVNEYTKNSTVCVNL